MSEENLEMEMEIDQEVANATEALYRTNVEIMETEYDAMMPWFLQEQAS